jgi:uncharacterized protein YoxC
MAGFNLSIGADTRGFSSAIKSGLIDPLEDVEDVIDKVSRSGDDVGQGLEEGMRKAQRETKDAAEEIDTLQDNIKRVNKAAKDFGVDGGSGISDGVRKGTDDAKEGLGEFKDEANSTAREAAASFDGSAESIGDAFQEVAANAFAGFGPAGAAAGLLIAAGLGTVFAKIQEGSENTEEFKAKVAELGQEFIDAGGVGEASLDFVIDKLKELATTTEDGVTSLDDLQDAVSKADGKNFEDIATAVAGAGGNIDDLVKKQEKYLEQLEEESQLADASVSGAQKSATEKAIAQQLVVDELHKAADAAHQARDAEAAYNAAGGPELEAKAESVSDYADAVQDAYADAGASVEEYTENGVTNLQKYTEEAQAQADAVTAYQTNMVALSGLLSDEALAYVASLGPKAAPIIDAFVKAPLSQQQQTAAVWQQLGSTSTNAFSNKVKNDLSGANYSAPVRLLADGSNIQQYLNQTKTQNVLLRVQNRIDLPANQGMGVP